MKELLTDFVLGIRKYVLGMSDESLDIRRGLMNLYGLLMHFQMTLFLILFLAFLLIIPVCGTLTTF